MKSAQQGQPYAAYVVAQFYAKGEVVSKDEKLAQHYYKQALNGFLSLKAKNQADDNLLYKIGAMYKNGLGTDKDIKKAIEYFKQSAELNNKHGLYEYGKILLNGKDIQQNISKALQCLEKSIKLENINAKRYLALEYIKGENIEQNIEKGITELTECADSGDAISAYKLGKLYFKGEVVSKNLYLAEKCFLIADENEFAEYLLGKLYLTDEKYDINKAISYFEKCTDTNHWASFQLGRIYLYGSNDVPKNKEKAVEWLTLSAESGNEYAKNMLEYIDDFENAMLANTVMSLFVNLSRCIADDYQSKFNSNRISVDKKLRKMIQQKRQALGIWDEQTISQQT